MKRLLLACLVSLTASYSICYSGLQYYSSRCDGNNTDAAQYMRMAEGAPVQGNYRYRVLTPLLAERVPAIPQAAFDPCRNNSPQWQLQVKFAAVNFLFLAGAGIAFFYYLGTFGFSALESLLGIALFYLARPVVQSAGIPMADAGSYFFIAACLLAARQGMWLLCAALFTIGLFQKETVLLVPLMLSLGSPKKDLARAWLCVPALAAYLAMRFWWYPDAHEFYRSFNFLQRAGEHARALAHPGKFADIFSSFGLVWLAAGYGFFRKGAPACLRRWGGALCVFMACVAVCVSGAFGRMLFLAFPAVIPLALWGIRPWAEQAKAAQQ